MSLIVRTWVRFIIQCVFIPPVQVQTWNFVTSLYLSQSMSWCNDDDDVFAVLDIDPSN